MNYYKAIFIDSEQGNQREAGDIEVMTYSLLFKSETRKLEIPFSRLEISRGGSNHELIFFLDTSQKDISIYTSEKAILKELSFHSDPVLLKQIKLIQRSRRKGILITSAVLSIILLAIASLFLLKDRLIETLANKTPRSWEETMGDKLFESLSLQYHFIHNDTLVKTIKEVAAPLLLQLKKDQVNVEFYFIKDPTINAFALPGGKIVIQSGLIEHAKSWEEVMGVLSHELAHVTRRHHVRGAMNNLGLFVVASALLGDVSAIAGTVINTGGQLASLSNSRSFEKEADETGLDYLIASHIDPQGMISFFTTLQSESFSKLEGYTSFLSTHPATEERIAYLKKSIARKKINKPVKIANDFNKFKQLISQAK